MEQKKNSRVTRVLDKLFSDKEWWLGLWSNILATVIGIVLTIGVTYYFEIQNDREQGRFIMYKVVENLKRDSMVMTKRIESLDKQLKACEELLTIYKENGKSMQGIADSIIKKHINLIGEYKFDLPIDRPELYFYDSNIMHQIGSLPLYSLFSISIQINKKSVEEMERLNKMQWDLLQQAIKKSETEDDDVQKIVEELIREDFIPNYYVNLNIRLPILKGYKVLYDDMIPRLLKEMKSSEEEYLEFRKGVEPFEINFIQEMDNAE
ncbi:MAG: hypothetical protein ACI4TW_00490 [Prevotella sp.]